MCARLRIRPAALFGKEVEETEEVDAKFDETERRIK
jgi:hypothetical protein